MLPLVRSRSRSGSRSNSSSPEIVSISSESRSPLRPPPARPRNSRASGSGGPTAGGAGASGSGGPAAGGGGPTAALSQAPNPGQDPATALLPTVEEWPVTHPFRVCWPLHRGEEGYVLPPLQAEGPPSDAGGWVASRDAGRKSPFRCRDGPFVGNQVIAGIPRNVPRQFQVRVQAKLRDASRLGCHDDITWSLPLPGQSPFTNALLIMDRRQARQPAAFYVGITEDPVRRWLERHGDDGRELAHCEKYIEMRVIWVAKSSRETGRLEMQLIDEWNRSRPLLIENARGTGGERPSAGSPHYCYVCFRTDRFVRHGPRTAGRSSRHRRRNGELSPLVPF